jgi:coenzyme F420-reducing hydrogenase delta subunit
MERLRRHDQGEDIMRKGFLFSMALAGCILAYSAQDMWAGTLGHGATPLKVAISADAARAEVSSPPVAGATSGISVEEAERQLTVLKRLCDQGLVSQEECQRRQQSILDQVLSSPPSTSPLAALSVVPADALGFIGISNLKQLDDRIAALIRDVGLVEALPVRAMLTAGREFIAGRKGFDGSSPVFLSLLEAPTPIQWATRSGLIVPTTDPDGLLASFNPEPPIDGVAAIAVFDTKVFAKTKKGALVIAPEPEAVKALASEATRLDTRLTPQDVKAISDLDLTFWINAARALQIFWAQIEPWTSAYRTMGGAESGSMQDVMLQRTLAYLHMLRDGLATLSGGLSLGQRGVGLRLAMSMIPASELASVWGYQEPVDGPLLLGLPNEDFVFAFGQTITAEQAKDAAKWLAFFFQAKEVREALGDAASERFKSSLTEWYGMLRGLGFAVYSPPSGGDGLVGLQAVCEVTDARQWIGHLRDIIIQIKALPSEEPQAQAALQAITYRLGTVLLEGVSIDEVHFDLTSLETAEHLQQMKEVVGRDGLTLRIGAVNNSHVAVSFGGGRAQMSRLIAHIKLGKTPLNDDLRIKAVADRLPKHRFVEGYFVLDRIATMVRDISQAVGERAPIPPTLYDVKAPVAFVTTGDNTSIHFDLHLPLEVLAALRSASSWQPGSDR